MNLPNIYKALQVPLLISLTWRPLARMETTMISFFLTSFRISRCASNGLTSWVVLVRCGWPRRVRCGVAATMGRPKNPRQKKQKKKFPFYAPGTVGPPPRRHCEGESENTSCGAGCVPGGEWARSVHSTGERVKINSRTHPASERRAVWTPREVMIEHNPAGGRGRTLVHISRSSVSGNFEFNIK